MRTPESPTFHIRPLPKRIRQDTHSLTLPARNDTFVPAVPTPTNAKATAKGKEVERWLHHVAAAHGAPAPASASPPLDPAPLAPIYFNPDADFDRLSAATAGGSPSVTHSDGDRDDDAMSVAYEGTPPPPPGAGSDADDDAGSSSGGSDSTWATTVRDGNSPGEWGIVVHPEWVRAAQRAVYSVPPRPEVEEVEEVPLWRRMLRAVLPFF